MIGFLSGYPLAQLGEAVFRSGGEAKSAGVGGLLREGKHLGRRRQTELGSFAELLDVLFGCVTVVEAVETAQMGIDPEAFRRREGDALPGFGISEGQNPVVELSSLIFSQFGVEAFWSKAS